MLQHTMSRLRTARVLPHTNLDSARLSPWLSWRPKRRRQTQVLSVAELSECTCPELCHRDHANE
jgi:hypothetical protein